jgi:hypothetical protein
MVLKTFPSDFPPVFLPSFPPSFPFLSLSTFAAVLSSVTVKHTSQPAAVPSIWFHPLMKQCSQIGSASRCALVYYMLWLWAQAALGFSV